MAERLLTQSLNEEDGLFIYHINDCICNCTAIPNSTFRIPHHPMCHPVTLPQTLAQSIRLYLRT